MTVVSYRKTVGFDDIALRVAKEHEARNRPSSRYFRYGLTTKEAQMPHCFIRSFNNQARKAAFDLSVELEMLQGSYYNVDDTDRYFVRGSTNCPYRLQMPTSRFTRKDYGPHERSNGNQQEQPNSNQFSTTNQHYHSLTHHHDDHYHLATT